jgi:hypothetical protein
LIRERFQTTARGDPPSSRRRARRARWSPDRESRSRNRRERGGRLVSRDQSPAPESRRGRREDHPLVRSSPSHPRRSRPCLERLSFSTKRSKKLKPPLSGTPNEVRPRRPHSPMRSTPRSQFSPEHPRRRLSLRAQLEIADCRRRTRQIVQQKPPTKPTRATRAESETKPTDTAPIPPDSVRALSTKSGNSSQLSQSTTVSRPLPTPTAKALR